MLSSLLGTLPDTTNQGISVIEIIVAIALLLIVVAGISTAYLGSLSSSRLAKEQVQASQYADAGLQAVTSIKNQGWDNMSAGSYGLQQSGGVWALSGSSDTDPTGTFTRVITISDVERDAVNDVVSSGGTIDPDSFRVTAEVSWNFSPTRVNTVSLETLLTNWEVARGAAQASLSPSPSVSPTPSPSASSCAQVCQAGSFTGGTCRQNTNQCGSNGEVYQSSGDVFCTGGSQADTCCCAP